MPTARGVVAEVVVALVAEVAVVDVALVVAVAAADVSVFCVFICPKTPKFS